jgi:hypothetical protein
MENLTHHNIRSFFSPEKMTDIRDEAKLIVDDTYQEQAFNA